MAVQYWNNRGEGRRTRFVYWDYGYHGDTLGAMSVSHVSQFHTPWDGIRADNLRRGANGQRARFRFSGPGRVALTDWAMGPDLVRLELDVMAAVGGRSFNLTDAGEPEQFNGALIEFLYGRADERLEV